MQCLEPLACLVCCQADVVEFPQETEDHEKTSLYADDALVYKENPTCLIPAALSVFQLFETYSGYHINLEKLITIYQLRNWEGLNAAMGTCRSMTSGFNYLGMRSGRMQSVS